MDEGPIIRKHWGEFEEEETEVETGIIFTEHQQRLLSTTERQNVKHQKNT